MLAVYGVVAAYAFGLLMNLSGWPFLLGIEVPGHERLAVVRRRRAPLGGEPAARSSSTRCSRRPASFDTGRAITNAVAIVVLGPAVLTTLRRAARRGDRSVGRPSATGGPQDPVVVVGGRRRGRRGWRW